jgi:exopolysaccharide biosynthesis polyprenyl glycosylphosphotransferase
VVLEEQTSEYEPVTRPRAGGRRLSMPTFHRGAIVRRMLAIADMVAIAFALALVTPLAVTATHSGVSRLGWGLVTLPAWILIFKAYGLYDRDGKRVSHSTVDDIPWLFHALVIGSLGLWAFYRVVAPTDPLILRQGVAFFVAAFAAIFLARAVARRFAQSVVPAERVVFVGGGAMALALVQKIGAHPEYGMNPIGYVDVRDDDDVLHSAVPYLGEPADVANLCRELGIDRVIVVSPAVGDADVAELIRRVKGLDIRISILPQLVDVLGPSVEIDDVEGITVLGINPPALTPSSRLLKRAMDVTIAAGVLTVSLPVLALAAMAIKLTSRGPVLFRQHRIGRAGRPFNIIKLRTMVADADQRREEMQALSEDPNWLLLKHDPRITPLGHLLRRTSIDELPQLWNVLKGDMSLVGPRPLPVAEDERISGWGRRRLDLTPGITGLWQVLGRTTIPFEEMVKLDYLYVTNWSLWQDVRLLIHTLPAILRGRGVN